MSNGSTTTSLPTTNIQLNSDGTVDWIILWTYDGGTTVYGKVMR